MAGILKFYIRGPFDALRDASLRATESGNLGDRHTPDASRGTGDGSE